MLGVDRRRADDDLGTVGAQHIDLVRGHLVRADEDALVALLLRDDRQADARVAARRLDDRAAGLQLTALFGGLDHAQGDPVLDRPAGVEVLDLGQNRRLDVEAVTLRSLTSGVLPTRLIIESWNCTVYSGVSEMVRQEYAYGHEIGRSD